MSFNENISNEGKKLRKNQDGILTELPISELSYSPKRDIKVLLRHNSLTLWSDMKEILFKYSLIVMNTLVINEISQKNQGVYLKDYSYLNCLLP